MSASSPSSPTAAAVVVAAGSATRMGATPARKPMLELAGRPMLEHACAAFNAASLVSELIVVAHADDVLTIERWCSERPAFDKVRAVVAGGAQRAESVALGVRWCSFDVDVIAIHDAARPLVRPAAIDAAVARAAADGAALVAVPVRDTLKVALTRHGTPTRRRFSGRPEAAADRRAAASDDRIAVDRTIDRGSLWAAQTPQCFSARAFREILVRAKQDAFLPTDDAALWERYKGPVTVVEGEPANMKITTPADLELAAAWLAARAAKGRSAR